MFNQYGVVSVTVQNIAEALGISPGNVTYHFSKKTDIIHAIIDRLQTELIELLDLGIHLRTKVDPLEHYQLVESIGRMLWRYRFVFNNILYLNSQDSLFGERFKVFQTNVIDTMTSLVEQSVKNGWIEKSKAPKSYEMLSENMWYIWLSSLRLSQLEPVNANEGEHAAALAMLSHHMAYMENYYHKEMYNGLKKFMQSFT